MILSHEDYAALLQTILKLHGFEDMETFRREAPAACLKIVGGDYFLLSDYVRDPQGRGMRLVDYVESEKRLARGAIDITEANATLPFTRNIMAGGRPAACKQTHFLTWNQNKHLVWDVSPDRVTGINRRLSLPVTSELGNATVINIVRRHGGYTERDRLILKLLQPHCDLAYRKLKRTAAQAAKAVEVLVAGGLSPREIEVANWLAGGKTNPEIAAILHAGVRTVEKHVERILDKLCVENRTTAAILITQSRGGDKLSLRPHFRHAVPLMLQG